jgi:Xaa-Pro aminopeptidase
MLRTAAGSLALLLAAAVPLAGQIPTAEYAQRRADLMVGLDSGVVVAYGGREPANHGRFYQLPSFRYLTGFTESDAALVLARSQGRVTATLFLARPDPRRALYYGDRKTPREVAGGLGLEARFADELDGFVDSLVARGLPVYSVPDIQAAEFSGVDTLTAGRMFVRRLEARHPGLRVTEIADRVHRLRAKKSPAEIELLKKAAAASSRAHEAAMASIRPGMGENEIQAVMEAEFRKRGADGPGYASIVGAGPNSTVLHHPAGTRVARSGEVVLMDVAAYWDGYSADITRTVPVDATFTPAQREFYGVVLAAEKAGERQIHPGVPAQEVADSIYAVLKTGLVHLGLVESEDASFDPPPGLCPGSWANDDGTCPQWYLYAYHGFSHGIGLDVHDPSQFSDLDGGTFEPGDVFTIEPGLYVRHRVLTDLPDTPRNQALIAHVREAVDRYRNVGVRVEDDYVVTPDGVERITDVPREIDEIEALRRKVISQE